MDTKIKYDLAFKKRTVKLSYEYCSITELRHN